MGSNVITARRTSEDHGFIVLIVVYVCRIDEHVIKQRALKTRMIQWTIKVSESPAWRIDVLSNIDRIFLRRPHSIVSIYHYCYLGQSLTRVK